jgi:hypothetical protein
MLLTHKVALGVEKELPGATALLGHIKHHAMQDCQILCFVRHENKSGVGTSGFGVGQPWSL